MKVIDLLNKIANGEKLPNSFEVKSKDRTCIFQTYITGTPPIDFYLFSDLAFRKIELNDEVKDISK